MEEEEIRRLHIDLLYQTVAINHLSPQVNGGTDFKRFKGKCRNYLRTPVELVGENCEELLEEMEKKGHIGIGDYKVLKDLVSFSDPLVREVESVESDIMQLMEKKKTRKRKASDSTDDSSRTEAPDKIERRRRKKSRKRQAADSTDYSSETEAPPIMERRGKKKSRNGKASDSKDNSSQTKDGEPDIRKLKQKLIEINSDTTKVIPISPLNKGRKYKMPVELLYASVVIREEQTDQEKGDMICRDVFARDTDYHTAIRHVLSSKKYSSLIILDGLDEWNPNEETKRQLMCQGMPNIEGVSSSVSCFFSMRPWVFSEISDMVKVGDSVIEIHGLSKTGMKKVIKNVLLNYYNLRENPSKFKATYKNIIGHLAEKKLKSFMKIPLLAVVCVQIWYKGEQVGGSMTSFYTSMLNMLIERAKLKHETAKPFCQISNLILPKLLSAKENIKTWIHVLIKLGKVAYEGLLSKQMKLVFQTEDLEKEIGERELQFALDVGLISQKEASSLTEKNVSVHFFHKSIQEFLAVIYIVTNKEVSDLFFEHLSNVKVIMELSNVIMFICGMWSSLGRVISQRVVSVTDSDGGICKYRESPWKGNSTVKELYKLQIRWYRELQYGQTDSLVTQTYSSVTQTDSLVTNRPVTFHVSDVYLDSRDTETVRGTRELLSDHHVDIRSLYLHCVPTDGERGITNTELCDFLSDTHRTRSLVMLYIYDGYNTGRSVPPLCGPSLRCLYLVKVTINTDLCGNVCPPLLTDMSQLRVLQLWYVSLGEGGLGLSPDMVHIERIQLYNVTLGEGGLGLSPDMVHIERIQLEDVTLGEGGLGLSPDMVHIERIHLVGVTLGEGGLGLSPDMVHIEEVELWSVDMPAAGWGELVRSVSHLQHRFNVVLHNTNIDDVSLTKIRSSPDFTVTRDGVDEDGEYELYFTRVWPPSQLTQGNVLLYTRVSPLS